MMFSRILCFIKNFEVKECVQKGALRFREQIDNTSASFIQFMFSSFVVISGSSLPLIFCIHVCSGPIYWGVVYLAKKIIR